MVVVVVAAVVVVGLTARCRLSTPVRRAILALCARVRHMFGAMLGVFCAIYVDFCFRCDLFRPGPPLQDRSHIKTMGFDVDKIESGPIQALETL